MTFLAFVFCDKNKIDTLNKYTLPAANYFYVNQDYQQTNIPVKVISVEDGLRIYIVLISTHLKLVLSILVTGYNIVVKCLILNTC